MVSSIKTNNHLIQNEMETAQKTQTNNKNKKGDNDMTNQTITMRNERKVWNLFAGLLNKLNESCAIYNEMSSEDRVEFHKAQEIGTRISNRLNSYINRTESSNCSVETDSEMDFLKALETGSKMPRKLMQINGAKKTAA